MTYAYNPALSYMDHLRLRDSMRESCADAGTAVSDAINNGTSLISSHLEAISAGLSDVTSALDRIDSTVDWGFSCVLAELGEMSTSLKELVKIAKSPDQTAAYEHFDLARRNFKQGLFPECLARLDKAIHGDKKSSGFQEEWRFHQLAGTMYLECADRSLINLPEAEKEFRVAARYAKAEHPFEAAGALVAAAVAAYSQGKMAEALKYAEDARDLAPDLGEAYFQAAKAQLYLKELTSAFKLAGKAIELDIGYARRVAEDGEFKRSEKALAAGWNGMRIDAMNRATQTRTKAESILRDLSDSLPGIQKSCETADQGIDYAYSVDAARVVRRAIRSDSRAMQRNVERLRDACSAARQHAGTYSKTLYDSLVAQRLALDAKAKADLAQKDATDLCALLSEIEQVAGRAGACKRRGAKIGAGTGFCLGLALTIIVLPQTAVGGLLGGTAWILGATALGSLIGLGVSDARRVSWPGQQAFEQKNRERSKDQEQEMFREELEKARLEAKERRERGEEVDSEDVMRVKALQRVREKGPSNPVQSFWREKRPMEKIHQWRQRRKK